MDFKRPADNLLLHKMSGVRGKKGELSKRVDTLTPLREREHSSSLGHRYTINDQSITQQCGPRVGRDERISFSFICTQTRCLSPALANAGHQKQTDVMIRFKDIWLENVSEDDQKSSPTSETTRAFRNEVIDVQKQPRWDLRASSSQVCWHLL